MTTKPETSGEDENYTRNEWKRWKLHSKRVVKTGPRRAGRLANVLCEILTNTGSKYSGETTLETSGEDWNHNPNEWRTLKSTLETGGEERKLHSKRVEKIEIYTRNEWRRCKYTLETSGEKWMRRWCCLCGQRSFSTWKGTDQFRKWNKPAWRKCTGYKSNTTVSFHSFV